MVIDINAQGKYIDIWLSHGETPPDVSAYRQAHPGYSVAVFHSGSGDLKALTAELLRVNL